MRETYQECEADIEESTGELMVVLCQLSSSFLGWCPGDLEESWWSLGGVLECWSCGGVLECWSVGGGVHGCPAGPPTLVPGVASLAEAGPQPHCHITAQCSQ